MSILENVNVGNGIDPMMMMSEEESSLAMHVNSCQDCC